MSIIPERLELLPRARVVRGEGPGVNSLGVPHGCAMELWTWVRGLPWSDQPECVDPRLAWWVRRTNDHLTGCRLADFARRIAVVDLTPDGTCGLPLNRLEVALPSRDDPSSTWSAFAKRLLEVLGA